MSELTRVGRRGNNGRKGQELCSPLRVNVACRPVNSSTEQHALTVSAALTLPLPLCPPLGWFAHVLCLGNADRKVFPLVEHFPLSSLNIFLRFIF